MKKRDIVKSNLLFNDIICNGSRKSNKYFIVYNLEKEEINPKFGIAVGKKNGNAVNRNKIKRQMRNIIDRNRNIFQNNNNYIVICKKEVTNLNFQEMEINLIKLIKGVANEK